MPMCGFSSTIVNILNAYDVEYEAVNVLEDPEIRINYLNFLIGLQYLNFL